MYKKIILIISIIILSGFNGISFNAQVYLRDEDANIQKDKICSNYNYNLYDEGNEDYKMVDIYNESNYLLEEYETNTEELEIVVPNGVSNIKMVVSNIEEDKNSIDNLETLNFAVEDCGYDEIKEAYNQSMLNSTITLNQNTLSFDLNEDKANYELYYRTEDNLKGEKVTQDTKIEISQTPYIIQLNEKYNGDNDNVTNFYEVTIYGDGEYIIRQIKDFDVSQIKAPPISNIYFYIFITLVLLFFFFRYKEKRYRKKRKRLLQKRRRKPKKRKK